MSTSQQMSPPFASPAPPPPPRRAQTVAGVVFATVGALALAGSALIGVATATHDTGGYLTSDPGRLGTDRNALVVSSLDVDGFGSDAEILQRFVGSLRLTVDGSAEPLFVGIGPARQVADYLASVSYDEVVDFSTSPFRADYRAHDGGVPSEIPAAQDFWIATATSESPQVIDWEPVSGEWSVVLMNADGSAGVAGYVTVGTTVPVLSAIVTTMAWSGGAFLAIGLVLMAGAALGRSRDRRNWEQPVQRG